MLIKLYYYASYNIRALCKTATAVLHHTLHIALYNYTSEPCVTAAIYSVVSTPSGANTHVHESGTTCANTPPWMMHIWRQYDIK